MIFPHRCLATWPRSTASVQVGRVFPVAGAIIVTACPKGARNADFSPQERQQTRRSCGLKSALLSKTRLLGQALVAVCSALLCAAAEPEPIWKQIAPFFSPPAEYAGQFGTYKSP